MKTGKGKLNNATLIFSVKLLENYIMRKEDDANRNDGTIQEYTLPQIQETAIK